MGVFSRIRPWKTASDSVRKYFSLLFFISRRSSDQRRNLPTRERDFALEVIYVGLCAYKTPKTSNIDEAYLPAIFRESSVMPWLTAYVRTHPSDKLVPLKRRNFEFSKRSWSENICGTQFADWSREQIGRIFTSGL